MLPTIPPEIAPTTVPTTAPIGTATGAAGPNARPAPAPTPAPIPAPAAIPPPICPISVPRIAAAPAKPAPEAMLSLDCVPSRISRRTLSGSSRRFSPLGPRRLSSLPLISMPKS